MIKNLWQEHFLILLVIVVVLIGCDNNGSQEPDLKKLKVDVSEEKDFLLSNLVDTLIIVPLETQENALIGSVAKVETTDKYIFVLDNSIAEALFMFDWNGNLIHAFQGNGDGPREFIRASNFFLNPNMKSVYIQDNSLGKIIELDYKGEFIQEKKIDPKFWIYDLFPIADGFISVKSEEDVSGMFVDLLNKQLDLKEILLDINDEINVFGGVKPKYFFKGLDGKIYFKQLLSNYIYSFTSEGDFEKIEFSFTSSNWIPSKNPILPRDAYMEVRNNNSTALSDEFLEFENNWVFNYWAGGILKSAIYSKNDGVCFGIKNIENDIDGLFKRYPGVLPINSNPNQFVLDVHPDDFVNQLSDQDFDLKYSEIFHELNSEKNDNPILLIYKKIVK